MEAARSARRCRGPSVLAAVVLAAVLVATIPLGSVAHPSLHTRTCFGPPSFDTYTKMIHEDVFLDQMGALAGFKVTNGSGKLITDYTPGETLLVEVQVSESSAANVMASTGTLYDRQGGAAVACDGRNLFIGENGHYPSGPAKRLAFIWMPPATATGAAVILFQWSTSSVAPISVASITLPPRASAPAVAVPPGAEAEEPLKETPPAGDGVLSTFAAPTFRFRDIALEVYSVLLLIGYLAALLLTHKLMMLMGMGRLMGRRLFKLSSCGETGLEVTVEGLHYAIVSVVFLGLSLALQPTLSSWASRLGWIAAFAMAMTLLPTGRVSVLGSLLNQPFQQRISTHRVFGYVFYSAVIVHGIASLIVWTPQALLSELDSFQIRGGYSYTLCIMSGVIAFALFTTSTLLAIGPVRRRFYTFFKLSHYLAVLAIVMAMLHSPRMIWMVIISLLSWVADIAIRSWRRSRSFTATLTPLAGNVTKVDVDVSGTPLASIQPGQVVYLQVPAIKEPTAMAGREWHPFTICSAPGSSTMSLMVRSLTPGRWGAGLAGLVNNSAMQSVAATNALGEDSKAHMLVGGAAKRDLLVACKIDGPYGGFTVDPRNRSVVVLAAGGIGVTPMLSLAQHVCNVSDGKKPHVHFVWMARGKEVMAAWAGKTLAEMAARENFTLHLHDTQAAEDADLALSGSDQERAASLSIKAGRYDFSSGGLSVQALAKEFAELTARDVAVYCCGPTPLVADCHRLAKSEGYAISVETFLL